MSENDDCAEPPEDAESQPAAPPSGRLTRTARAEDAGMRLDRFWGRELAESGVSRERVKDWIAAGRASVDGRAGGRPSLRLAGGESLALDVPETPASGAPRPEAGPLEIVYRDAAVAVVNKPAGLTTHPAPSQTDGTLVNRLLSHFPELAPEVSGMTGDRPGIVHRLDKDTSGLLIVALTEAARLTLVRAFAERRVRKTYLAIVHGRPQGDPTSPLGPDAGDIVSPIGRSPACRTKMAVLKRGGREARTSWRRLWTDRLGRASLLAVTLHTGRTHQIRVHMAHLGHPLVGDAVYGPAEHARWLRQAGPLARLAPRQMLHAFRLSFAHPVTGAELSFRRDPPADFAALLRALADDCLRVVVTGAPGGGKSTFTRLLSELPGGPPTFSADACVARLYAPDGDGAELLARRFGRGLLAPDGGVDKAALRALLARRPELRRELEEMIHPLVKGALAAFWAENSWRPLAVAEIPLFFETGWRAGAEREADVAVGVRCPDLKRRGSMRESRGLAPETLATFESWQWPAERKLAACDLVAENAGSLDDLRRESGRVLAELEALRARKLAAFSDELARLYAAAEADA